MARLSGVTVRTLHHYDELGLLEPTGRTASGYRQYSTDDVDRLAQIVAYRSCGMSLGDIGRVLAGTGGQREEHLRRQIELLEQRLSEISEQRRVLIRALEARSMGINLNPEEIFEVFGEHDPGRHAVETEQRWGDTEAYAESNRRTSQYTKEDWLQARAEAEAIEREFAACQAEGLPPESQAAKAAAERHRMSITRWYYPCPHEMQVGLAEMYVADPRFAAHYDDRAPGLAQYVHDAILANAVDAV